MPGRAEVKRALAEARRVLAPRGALVVWEPRVLNPLNRHTHLISRLALQQALPDATWQTQTLTLFPPLARRLGRQTHRLYPRLSTARPLRSHQLSWARWP
jgi:ubiquinone/menaquinone biosynthesis C-methylase UbiE